MWQHSGHPDDRCIQRADQGYRSALNQSHAVQASQMCVIMCLRSTFHVSVRFHPDSACSATFTCAIVCAEWDCDASSWRSLQSPWSIVHYKWLYERMYKNRSRGGQLCSRPHTFTAPLISSISLAPRNVSRWALSRKPSIELLFCIVAIGLISRFRCLLLKGGRDATAPGVVDVIGNIIS